MRTQIFALHELQKIDSDIFEIEKRLEDLPNKLSKIDEKIKNLNYEKQLKENSREKTLSDKKQKEQEIEQEEQKIKTVESRLSNIKNPKDYQEIRKKLEKAKKANKAREEEVIKIMETVEKIEEELKTFFPEIDNEIEKMESSKKLFFNEVEQIKQKKEELIKLRDNFLHKIDADILKKYEFIKAKSHGIGVSKAKNEACEGCFMNLPPQLYNMIIKSDKLYNCPFCQRFLVYIPDVEEVEKSGKK